MKTIRLLLVSGLIMLWQQTTIAQPVAVNDTICSTAANFSGNVLINDTYSPTAPVFVIVLFNDADQCIHLSDLGELTLVDPTCCGEFRLRYMLEGAGQAQGATAEVLIKITCPKPDCSNVDLTPYLSPDQGAPCIAVCENSIATYHIDDFGLGNYPWNVSGGTVVAGQGTTDFQVQWGGPGLGNISLNNSLGGPGINICVNILAAPVANISGDTYVCLGTPANFSGAGSVGATSYFWDFGDASPQATGQSVTHSYTNPGSYQVSLIVTAANTTANGEPSCCCTDTTYWNIVVDSLPGPNIYCVSTLCEGDETKYWTDAACANYNWSISANGSISAGQGTDTICVTWATGPVGTVTLDVNPCAGYCTQPTTVNIPILPSLASISGPTVVCIGSTEIYSVPKWPGTVYVWSVSSDGVIVSPNGGHTVSIHWPSAGPRLVSVSYSNPFLQGLPGHTSEDCVGMGSLNVLVKPDFAIQIPNPNIVCVGDPGSYSILPSGNYTWTITPSAAFSGQGSSSISLNWNTAPGNYTISAVPNDTTLYCNEKSSISIQVVEMAKPQSITGETFICPGDAYLYQVSSNQTGTTFNWQVLNGSPASGTGTELNVTWGASGPYWIAVSQTMGSAPYCTSDTIQLQMNPKSLLPLTPISGPNGCVNSVQTYSIGPAQHPDAVYSWSFSNPLVGSVVSPQDSSSVNIQWNNISGQVTLTVNVTLCGVTLTQNKIINVIPAVQPVITSSGFLCSGGVTLCVNNVTVVSWSGGNTPTSACTTVSAAGQYTVTTTDANGCTATGITQVNDNGAPIAQISAPSVIICTVNSDPNETRSIYAISSPNSTYAWYCDNGSGPVLAVPQPSNPEIFIHTETGVDGNYAYYAIVTENTTGCSKQSNTVVITESSPCESVPPCDSLQTYSLSFMASDTNPVCNIYNLNVTNSPNVVLQSWNFGDPLNNINNLNTLNPAQHSYTNAGYYPITLYANVPRNTVPVTFCPVSKDTIVCVPVGANFQWSSICSTVNLNQMASVLTGFSIAGYQWDFGDSNTGSGPSPSHTYAIGGTYAVKLTVTLTSGCTAEVIKNVTVAGNPAISISINPNPPYCVGDALNFSGSGSNIISWLWGFGDASQNGAQNASHTYTGQGTYTVTLTGTNADGCVGSATQIINVNAAPVPGVITFAPSLTFCQGDAVTLTAPTCSGCTYLWSNGATSPVLSVNTAGEFSVKVTDANGCFYITPKVTTNVLGLPDPTISGNPIICDQGSTVLSVAPGAASYVWEDASNTVVSTGNTVTIFANSIVSPYTVTVTGTNGCVASASIAVSSAISPAFSVSISPNACAGSPSTLSVVPVQVNVTYAWSNAVQGPVMTTSIAGTYYVTGTDSISGCSSTASGTINPQPELCSFPTGCYDICAPDTICGPDGLASYTWYHNNIAVSADQCIVLSLPGTYSLTATNSFGCSSSTDDLIIKVVPCDDCDDVSIDFDLVIGEGEVENPCCAVLDYTNNYSAPLSAIQIRTVNGGLSYSNVSSSFIVGGSTSTSVDLLGNPSNGPLPNGSINDFIQACIINPTSSPQLLIIDWYGLEFEIVCSDTLELHCPIEPGCLYLASDSIYCDGLVQTYEMTVCNPINTPFPVYYIDLQVASPITLSPPNLSLNTPIYPGQCRTFTFTLGGSYVPGDTLCYKLFAHNADPHVVDTALCCATLEQYYVVIPDCDPCDDVSVVQNPSEDCCVNWSIVNNFQAGYFDGIDICVLTPNSTLTINNTIGSGWQTVSNNGTLISLNKKPAGSFIGLGTYPMPMLCMNSSMAPGQLVEIKWMQGDSIVCRDTLIFHCPPPCGFVMDTVTCNPDGGYSYDFKVTNTSAFAMHHATLIITSPTGFNTPQTYILGPLASGGTSPWFNLILPANIGNAGDTICYTLALHEEGADEFHINCCNITHCFVLPDCGPAPDCECDEEFLNTQSSIFDQNVSGNQVVFFPTANLPFNPACDVFHWNWGDGNESLNQPFGSVSHTYAGPGAYQVCVNVIRSTPTELCELIFCYNVFISSSNDQDGDGIPDDLDNCPAVFNPSQADMDADGIGDACDDDVDGDGFSGTQDCDDFNPSIFPNALEICDSLDNDCDGTVDENCSSCDLNNICSNMDVVEIDFGSSNPRVNATWNNPNGTASCQVRGGRISSSSAGTTNPQFANINNTQVISQTNGSTVLFNIALYNNPNIPFVIGQTYGFEVRCLCEDGLDFTNWSGIIPSATFVVPSPPAGPPAMAYSDEVANQQGDLVGKALSENAHMRIYPNPSEGDQVRIELTNLELETGIVTLLVLDMTGKQVYTERIPVKGEALNTLLDFRPTLTSGMYFISVDVDGIMYREKFMVK